MSKLDILLIFGTISLFFGFFELEIDPEFSIRAFENLTLWDVKTSFSPQRCILTDIHYPAEMFGSGIK